jgi:diguanylate cyclase (GGDEF)-like protein
MTRELVLVADDDEDIVRFVEVNLRLEGFEVVTAADGEQALQIACESSPDLALLDVMMPRLDGVEVVQRLRSDARTRHISVIMLTAKSMSADKVVGLTAGADDYMIKPFDPIELVARVKSTLRRSHEMRDVNPLPLLPGNLQVQDEIARRIASGEPVALMHVDLDNFKAYNDYYGFLRGDEVIKTLAAVATEAVRSAAGTDDVLVGHVGGDDFVLVLPSDGAQGVAEALIAAWDDRVRNHYDVEDLRRGYIEVNDRRGHLHRFPIMAVSIGIAGASSPASTHREVAAAAAEMKLFAKRDGASSYATDRRAGGAGGVPGQGQT